MTYPTHLIPTTVVGSYPQPDWLVDRSALAHHGVPRVSARDIWRIAERWLEQAQDDATVVAIRDMERAGIDIVSDGEIRRESYSNRFALALDGIDAEQGVEHCVRPAPDKAARYGIKAINRALEGISGPTIVHLCFGYAAMVRNKPSGYAFLPQLADTVAAQISIEAAQPRLDLGVLKELSGKTIVLGVLDLNDPAVETAEE